MNFENHYTYRTEWSHEDESFISRALEFPSLSAFGDTRIEAENELDKVIIQVINWLKEENSPIPQPITEKEYKGNIALRIPPEAHRNVALIASQEGVSINQFITSLIERNMYCDSIASLVQSFDQKLNMHYENLQKLTCVNVEIYKRFLLMSENASPKEDQNVHLNTNLVDSNYQAKGLLTA
ncbi:MAG: toxin-antitoxin system HicB family antitoxin [Spirochaetes bacterium]|nr:toxin-antitoxin system HicB family antitoxin [Spirochaetota bacterium]